MEIQLQHQFLKMLPKKFAAGIPNEIEISRKDIDILF